MGIAPINNPIDTSVTGVRMAKPPIQEATGAGTVRAVADTMTLENSAKGVAQKGLAMGIVPGVSQVVEAGGRLNTLG